MYGLSIVMEQEPDTNLILESADGTFLSGIEEDIASEQPTLSKEQAIAKALLHNNDTLEAVQNVSPKYLSQ